MASSGDYPLAHEVGWRQWPVAWSPVWVGTLAALAVGLLIGLIGFAVGAHEVASSRIVKWSNVRLVTVVFSVAGAFFSFVVGGWVVARIAGIRRSEPAMLHGALVWLLAVPLLLALAALGATAHFGSWYGGLAGVPAWSSAVPSVNPDFAAAQRNTALLTAAALLLGLIGSVLGGWMASGEPMSLTYYRRREAERVHVSERRPGEKVVPRT